MQNQQEQQKQLQAILQALNLQRAQAVKKLNEKAQSLLDSDKLTVEHLGNADTVAVLRDTLQGISSAASALAAHDKLISMLVQDMGACASNIENIGMLMNQFVGSSMVLEALINVMVSKGIVTEDEVKSTHAALVAKAKEQMKEEMKKEEANSAEILGLDGKPIERNLA